MEYQKGDILVFKGNIDNDPHYNNFEEGKHYRIESIQTVQYDIDESLGYCNDCILFEKHMFGTLITNAEKYFTSITDKREETIKKIIEP